MANVRRLVLDLLKPHEPDVVTFAESVAGCDGVAGVNVVLMETDKEVQNVKLTIEGDSIPVDAVHDTVEDLGGTVHSIDEVVCGEFIVEESKTPQD
ncbi:DUF211 domain-containing protein [Halogeometricum sp. S1BR25-6]|uniref:DUF211 domain-containing protein n=1 Tax=Halogeometricum salsisoli TaxID=2950536 RepID=A0ABU2GJP9_9EURY|nr:DUF211 domain-containing protein [Halogeometricum sp. S1BR25-6]MDS0301042.1 DUF211 domain-containing protein [Halogeometricum sp. S1BR25-6]